MEIVTNEFSSKTVRAAVVEDSTIKPKPEAAVEDSTIKPKPEATVEDSTIKPKPAAAVGDSTIKLKPAASKPKFSKRDATLNLSEVLLGKMRFLGGNAPS